MPRRHFSQEPTSKLAIWARRMALFALAAAFLSVVILRSGLLEIWPALATFFGALGLAILAVLLAFAAFVVIWKDGLSGMGYAFSAIGIGLALLAYPAYLAVLSYRLPWIYDVTTDPIDPPRYEALARIRPRDANPVIYAGLSAAEQQREAYPDIEPLDADASPLVAYNAALAVITKRKWRIVDQRPPTAGRREGRIEAVAFTLIMGFRDDVVVRVRPEEDGARVDVRSSSRYGTFDFGANAARIRNLLEEIEDVIDAQRPEESAPAPAKKKGTQPKGGPAKKGGQGKR